MPFAITRFHADAWVRRSLDQSGHDLLSDWFLAQGAVGPAQRR